MSISAVFFGKISLLYLALYRISYVNHHVNFNTISHQFHIILDIDELQLQVILYFSKKN